MMGVSLFFLHHSAIGIPRNPMALLYAVYICAFVRIVAKPLILNPEALLASLLVFFVDVFALVGFSGRENGHADPGVVGKVAECRTKPPVRHAEMTVPATVVEITVVKLEVTVLKIAVTVLAVTVTVLEGAVTALEVAVTQLAVSDFG